MPPKKKRVEIPEDLKVEILFLSNRTCCVCRVVGKQVQIHHIDDNPANNDPQNLAALCFDCHNETQMTGGFGRKLSAGLVRRYRDDWLVQAEKWRTTHAQPATRDADMKALQEKDNLFVSQVRAEQRQHFREAAKIILNAAIEYKSVANQLGYVLGGETEETRNQRLNASLKKALSPVDDAIMSLSVEGKAELILAALQEIRTAFYQYSNGLETNKQFHGTYTLENLQAALHTIDTKVEELTTLIQQRLRELGELTREADLLAHQDQSERDTPSFHYTFNPAKTDRIRAEYKKILRAARILKDLASPQGIGVTMEIAEQRDQQTRETVTGAKTSLQEALEALQLEGAATPELRLLLEQIPWNAEAFIVGTLENYKATRMERVPSDLPFPLDELDVYRTNIKAKMERLEVLFAAHLTSLEASL